MCFAKDFYTFTMLEFRHQRRNHLFLKMYSGIENKGKFKSLPEKNQIELPIKIRNKNGQT